MTRGASLKSCYKTNHLGLSFEVFPPKSTASLESLYRVVEALSHWNPAFLSVTYGAGGSTRAQSLEILAELRRRTAVPLTAHFTCVGSRVAEIEEWLEQAAKLGVENIMALRGDPPQGQENFTAVTGGLSHASELVQLIRSKHPAFGIGVAGYPEPHKESDSPEADLRWLKHKVDQGADSVFTQLFYRNSDFYRFRENCEAIGIDVPVVPGILPVLGLEQLKRITKLCGASIPSELMARLEKCEGQPSRQLEVGIEYATAQCEDLCREGVPGIHFYVLNRSDIIQTILSNLGLQPND
jgi:methylenetetrahydrofolate reductase (NADPH)